MISLNFASLKSINTLTLYDFYSPWSNHHLLAAQIIATIAFFISLAGWWLAWLSGLVALVILLIGCCATFHKNVWLAVGILSAIAALGDLLVAVRVVDENVYCSRSANCHINEAGSIVLSIIALLLWLVVSFITINQFRIGGSAGNTADELPT